MVGEGKLEFSKPWKLHEPLRVKQHYVDCELVWEQGSKLWIRSDGLLSKAAESKLTAKPIQPQRRDYRTVSLKLLELNSFQKLLSHKPLCLQRFTVRHEAEKLQIAQRLTPVNVEKHASRAWNAHKTALTPSRKTRKTSRCSFTTNTELKLANKSISRCSYTGQFPTVIGWRCD